MLLVDRGLEPQDDFNLLLRLRGTMGEFYPPKPETFAPRSSRPLKVLALVHP